MPLYRLLAASVILLPVVPLGQHSNSLISFLFECESLYVAQAALKPVALLLQPSSCWDSRCKFSCQALICAIYS